MNDQMAQRWHTFLTGLGVEAAAADRAFADIRLRYAEPGRFYHTLDHVAKVLDTVDRLSRHTRDANAVRMAAWLHDVIYDGRASDNEERSAAYAVQLSASLGIPEEPRIASLILRTKTHNADDDADAKVLLDADLAILGVGETEYLTYAEQIRQEYAWVPQADYRAGRQRVLAKFLARPTIYYFLGDLELRARRNLSAEIERLNHGSS
jgi:predicted metal-dependent HD superfamily phosphohydrolase